LNGLWTPIIYVAVPYRYQCQGPLTMDSCTHQTWRVIAVGCCGKGFGPCFRRVSR